MKKGIIVICLLVAGLSYGQSRFWEDAMKTIEESSLLIAEKKYDEALAKIHPLKTKLMAKKLTVNELTILLSVVSLEMGVAGTQEDFDTVIKLNQELSKKLHPEVRQNDTFALAYYGNLVTEQYYLYLADPENLATLEAAKKNLHLLKSKIKAHSWTNRADANAYDQTIDFYSTTITTKMKELGGE